MQTPTKYCVLCPSVKSTPTPLDDDTTPEHPIPNRLGGRLERKDLICDICNVELGSTIDKALVDDFLWIRNGLEIRSGRRQEPPPIRGVSSPIGKINLAPGWKPQRARTERIVLSEREFRVISHDSEKGVEAIVHYLRSLGINSIAECKGKFQITGKDVSGRLPNANIDVAIGGPDTSRAIAKIAFEYLAHTHNDVVFQPAFDLVRNYIRVPMKKLSHSNTEPTCFDFVNRLPRPKLLFPNFDLGPYHYIGLWNVQTNATLALVADVILFGFFRWTVELASIWSGKILSNAYVLNPMTGRSATCQLPAILRLSPDWKTKRRVDSECIGRQIWQAKLMCEQYQELQAHHKLLIECAQEVLGITDISGDREISPAEEAEMNRLYNIKKERFNENYRREVPIEMHQYIQEIDKRMAQMRKR